MVKKLILIIFLILVFPVFCFAEIDQSKVDQLKNQIEELEKKLSETQNTKNTLANQIKIIDSQVELTQLKINQTEANIVKLEQEIQSLAVEINKLDLDLNQLTNVFIGQINQNYRLQKQGPPVASIIFNNFNAYLQERKYLLAIQKNSQETILNMETTRTTKDIQKNEKEIKQTELETLKNSLANQKAVLAKQKVSKKELLDITKNSEANYQSLLNQTKLELLAIEGILAGRGDETAVGNVNKGDRIASVIEGSSCNSSGTHLHFMIKKANETGTQNPFNYLKAIDSTNASGGDPFNPSGSWDWPLSAKIELEQGYGYTWAVQHTWVKRIYSFHNGIDINGSNNEVKAVHSGKLFRGSFKSGCNLKYVRVQNDAENIETFYLHVNYF